jgi:carboxymethylenebutenolidase
MATSSAVGSIRAPAGRESIVTERPQISQEMIRLYDEYTHLTLDRRGFMEKLTKLAGSSAAAYAILPLIAANHANAAIVPEDDPRVSTEMVTYPGADGTTMSGYLAMPTQAPEKLPAVMVIHENRGLNPHIQDVARRFAAEGFLALAPDFLAPAGGTPADEDKAREMISDLDQAQTVANSVASVEYLRNNERGNGKVGVVGFCWGGGLANQTAVHAGSDLAAGVAFYGRAPEAADVAKIQAPMLLHFAGLDERVNAGMPGYDAALKATGIPHEIHVYEGANHAFMNDTSEARYKKDAAELAWSRTLDFLKRNLASS